MKIKPNSKRWLNVKNLPDEKWQDIKDFEGLYQISNYGRVKSLERYRKSYNKLVYVPEIIRKNGNDKNGYQILPLNKNSRKYIRKIHRLVAEAFIPNPENKPCVDHINCQVDDNRVENLRWATVIENNKYCYDAGRLFDLNAYMKKVRKSSIK